MNRFSVLGADDNAWQEIVTRSRQYDIYHTLCYHLLETEGTPVLLHAEFGSDFIALPLMLRKIKGTDYQDLTCSYGFCGPISNLNFEKVSSTMFSYLRKELDNYFTEQKIISAFSRLHPIIIGDELFQNLGTIRNVKDMVAIDLSLSSEAQVKQYRKSNRSEISQLRYKGFTVREALSDEDIKSFVAVYHQTMKRVSAGSRYFFDLEYFSDLMHNKCFDAKLLLAIKDGAIVAGAIFTIAGKIMQYHLAGTKQEYIREAPMKLILDEARLLGNKLNLEYLHLGGSVGDIEEDSLFRFKSGFSSLRFKFRLWQHIVNEKIYKELNQLFKTENKADNYFPQYRA